MGSAHQWPKTRRLAKAQVQFQIPVRSLFNLAYFLCFEIPPSPMLSKVSLMGLSHTTLGVLGRTVFLWVLPVYLFHCMDSTHPSIERAPLIMRQNRPRLPIRPQNDV